MNNKAIPILMDLKGTYKAMWKVWYPMPVRGNYHIGTQAFHLKSQAQRIADRYNEKRSLT